MEPSGEHTRGTPRALSEVRSCPLRVPCTSITSPSGEAKPLGGAKTTLGPLGLKAATL